MLSGPSVVRRLQAEVLLISGLDWFDQMSRDVWWHFTMCSAEKSVWRGSIQ